MHEEQETLEAQMGRPLEGSSRVAARCHLGLPVVIESAPVTANGAPFPTLYYLTCPLARTRISRLEHAGWIRDLTARLSSDPDFAREVAQADEAYRGAREALLPPHSPVRARLRGGVGGAVGGIKCLHAHFAHLLAGGANPVGAAIEERVLPLDCAAPCVREGRRNPAWREPQQGIGA